MITRTDDVKVDMEILDLSLLSEQAKQELIDFYQFLLERYGTKSRSLRKLPETFYDPVKTRTYQRVDRGEIYNDR